MAYELIRIDDTTRFDWIWSSLLKLGLLRYYKTLMIINPVNCIVEAFHNLCFILCFEHTNPVSGVWAVVMGLMLWINGYIAWFCLMSSPHVPFHKYINHRLYPMMSCGQIVILDVRKSFLDLSAFGNRTASGKPDWWSWVARSSATNPASITMKILSLVWLYHQF